MESSVSGKRLLLFLGGPALLLVALALPCFGPLNARFAFGILFWMVWWWVTTVVDIKLTCLVPIFVACFYGYMPLTKVMEAYVHKEAVLIFGATAITAAWVRWGFARRLALNFLMRVSGNVRAQTAGWFVLCAITSFVVGNTTVAAMFAPIAVAALMYVGYENNEQRWNSRAASNILIAVAWGASVGGMATPLGGGQSVVTFGLLNKYLGYDIYFIDWTLRMVPVSLVIIMAVGALMFFMPSDRETFGGTREFYRQELDNLGPMTFEEKISFFAFALAIGLAVLQPLYAPWTKGPMWDWLKPTHSHDPALCAVAFVSRREHPFRADPAQVLSRHHPVHVARFGGPEQDPFLDRRGRGVQPVACAVHGRQRYAVALCLEPVPQPAVAGDQRHGRRRRHGAAGHRGHGFLAGA